MGGILSCFLFDEKKSKAVRAFEAFTYASTLLDLLDAGFDYAQVAELAQYQDTRKHAAWLGVCTTIALFLELVVKTGMRRKKDKNTAEGHGGAFDMDTKECRNNYIGLSGAMELVIFCVEDATTVFVWWQTGTYDSQNGLVRANLITTVFSAVGASTALLYGMIRFVPKHDGCTAWLFGIVAVPLVAALAFWAVVALTTIQGGEWYDCIGSCAANANATANTTTTTLAGSDTLVLGGSGSSFGSGGGGAGEGGSDGGLNRAVIGVYVVGWIVAVLGGGFTTWVAFKGKNNMVTDCWWAFVDRFVEVQGEEVFGGWEHEP